jgi:AraC-like DNA-binding protein
MKPVPFKVTEKDDASFHVQINRHHHQYDKLHFHPEYQVSLIVEGHGMASIGSSIGRFQPGDIYAIGPNVPHVFKNDREHYDPGTSVQSYIISFFFRETSFGRDFFKLPEMVTIKKFLEDCARGVKLNRTLAHKIKPRILELAELTGAMRIIQLLTILNNMALSTENRLLSAVRYEPPSRPYLYSRLNRIIQYISDNFDKQITLDEAAKVANLSKYAFCRYFKRSTHKSFIHYLNEFRVGMACKLLSRTNYNVTQIGLLTGFNNLSYFNRQFRKFMNCTPTEYRDLQRGLV